MDKEPEDERVRITLEHYSRFPFPSTIRTQLPDWLPRRMRNWLIKPKGKRYERALAQLVPPEKRATGRLLDAGCGTGEITVTVATRQRWGEIMGIDLTPRSLEIAEQYAKSQDVKVEFRRSNLLDASTLPEGPFTAITCLGVVHHLPNPAEGLANLAGLLAEDGVMLLYFYGRLGRVGYCRRQELVSLLAPDEENLDARFQAVKQLGFLRKPPGGVRGLVLRSLGVKADEMVYSRAMDDYANANEKQYSATELVDLLAEAGLEVVRWFRGIPERASDMLPKDVAARIESLPERERLHAMDLALSPAQYTVGVRRIQPKV